MHRSRTFSSAEPPGRVCARSPPRPSCRFARCARSSTRTADQAGSVSGSGRLESASSIGSGRPNIGSASGNGRCCGGRSTASENAATILSRPRRAWARTNPDGGSSARPWALPLCGVGKSWLSCALAHGHRGEWRGFSFPSSPKVNKSRLIAVLSFVALVVAIPCPARHRSAPTRWAPHTRRYQGWHFGTRR